MIEHIKTVLLWILILLSVFLTWQIWTFQPDYAILKSTEYIEYTQIGEQKKVEAVVVPEQMIFHHNSEHYIALQHKGTIELLYDQFQQATYEQFHFLDPADIASTDIGKGVELIFPASVSAEIIRELFDLPNDMIYVKEVDRVIFFVSELFEKQYVSARFISFNDELIVQARTNIPVSEFREEIEREIVHLPSAFAYELVDYRPRLKETIYLPKDAQKFHSVTYMTKPIASEHFKHVLFSDPNFVKHYMQTNGEESLTDGNRMVNVLHGGTVLRYIHPSFTDNQERTKDALVSVIEFLNGHGGWTDHFFYANKKTIGTKEEVIFRMSIDGLPIYRSNGSNHLYEMTVIRAGGNQVEQYIRPLFYVEDMPMNIRQSVMLPSGYDIISELEQREQFNPYLLKKLVPGFFMEKRQAFIVFEPRWFALYNGSWEVVALYDDSKEGEAAGNGLE